MDEPEALTGLDGEGLGVVGHQVGPSHDVFGGSNWSLFDIEHDFRPSTTCRHSPSPKYSIDARH
ncbi:MAG: hypothetical protein ACLQPH_20245 [Acidimicrobiales bacterium]